ncbi:hypothetical protein DSO57_1011786 [Entomophthora muscae]|uniref:Uncharacterized protein n=1 Tax=Entomophthora muscae TaxID=34485 RepID=A0ACC2TH21_9FUNG|nr:hypothetical protein DSO57_1011786 [Entomophthora muscae]
MWDATRPCLLGLGPEGYLPRSVGIPPPGTWLVGRLKLTAPGAISGLVEISDWEVVASFNSQPPSHPTQRSCSPPAPLRNLAFRYFPPLSIDKPAVIVHIVGRLAGMDRCCPRRE